MRKFFVKRSQTLLHSASEHWKVLLSTTQKAETKWREKWNDSYINVKVSVFSY